MVDRVVEVAGGKARTIKNVTHNEPFFVGHFPGHPVMPGVLIIEALAQSAAVLALAELKAENQRMFVLTGVEKARFRRPVVPGDQTRHGSHRPAQSRSALENARGGSGRWRDRGRGRIVRDGSCRGETVIAGKIHPSAVIDSRAELDTSVEVGPGAVIGPNVKIGANTVVGPYAVIESNTTIGARNHIFQFASIGAEPQDLKFKGEPSVVEIGDDNLIREFCTIHRGTEGGGMITRIGNHVLAMNYVHVAHDCIIGDHCILANSTELAGHIVFEDHVRAMGGVLIQQFTKMGSYCMLAAGARVELDVPPYAIASGDRARLVGVHEIGLQRGGFSPEKINAHQERHPQAVFFQTHARRSDEGSSRRVLRSSRSGSAASGSSRIRSAASSGASVISLGLIAGNGSFPLEVAIAARRRGIKLIALAHQGETNPELEAQVDQLTWIKVGELQKIIDVLKNADVKQAAMAGGISRARLSTSFMPDQRAMTMLASIARWSDDAVLRAIAREIESEGIPVIDPVPLMDDAIAKPGLMAGPQPDEKKLCDLDLAFNVARSLGAFDIGQSVAVRGGVVYSVEAVEGTDAALRRAAAISGKGLVIAKVAKPGQDLRFDRPAIGPATIEMMAEIGAAMIGIEAGKCLLLERERTLATAQSSKLAVYGHE